METPDLIIRCLWQEFADESSDEGDLAEEDIAELGEEMDAEAEEGEVVETGAEENAGPTKK